MMMMMLMIDWVILLEKHIYFAPMKKEDNLYLFLIIWNNQIILSHSDSFGFWKSLS